MVEPDELQVVFEKATKDAKKLHHEYITLQHLFFAMLCSDNFMKVLNGFGIDPEPNEARTFGQYPKTKLDEIKVSRRQV